MNIILNIKELIRQYLPPYKRWPNRLNWLYSLLDLDKAVTKYESWKEDIRYRVYINSQHKVLETHLSKIFHARIYIDTYSDKYLPIGLNIEPTYWVEFDSMQPVALESELKDEYDGADFIVYAPFSVDKNLLAAEIEKYKLADKTYKIIQQ